MANQLRVAEILSILTLYDRGWSCRRIARELGVHRETVSKYVRRGVDPPESATFGGAPLAEGGAAGAKPATPVARPPGVSERVLNPLSPGPPGERVG